MRIKLEVSGEEDSLQPDVFGLVEAASSLTREGFQVFPYTTEDLVAAEKASCIWVWGIDALGIAYRIGARSPKAGDPVRMARAFALAVEAGRIGYRADLTHARDMAAPSTPVIGRAFGDLARAWSFLFDRRQRRLDRAACAALTRDHKDQDQAPPPMEFQGRG